MAINLLDNINYAGNKPLDLRLTVNTITELKNNIGKYYVGSLVYCLGDDKYYKVKSITGSGSYEEFNPGSGGDEPTITINCGYDVGSFKAGQVYAGTPSALLKQMLEKPSIQSITIFDATSPDDIYIGSSHIIEANVVPDSRKYDVSWLIIYGDSHATLTPVADSPWKATLTGVGNENGIVKIKAYVGGIDSNELSKNIKKNPVLLYTYNGLLSESEFINVSQSVLDASINNGYSNKTEFTTVNGTYINPKKMRTSYWYVCMPQSELNSGTFANYEIVDTAVGIPVNHMEKSVTINNLPYKLCYVAVDPGTNNAGEGWKIK